MQAIMYRSEVIFASAYDYIVNSADTLKGRYCEPWRAYHTLDHIKNMCQDADALGINLTTAQSLAIAYHDAVYIPGCKMNERYSADLMRQKLTEGSRTPYGALVDEIEQIIMSTKDHIPLCKSAEAVIDLDLYGFSEVYRMSVGGPLIRKEFNSVSDADFTQGRISFLSTYIKRRPFYYTLPDEISNKAIKNMKAEYYFRVCRHISDTYPELEICNHSAREYCF